MAAKVPAVPFPTMISPRINPVTDSLNCAVIGIGFEFVGSVSLVERVTEGVVVSTINDVTDNPLDTFHTPSVTVIVQLL